MRPMKSIELLKIIRELAPEAYASPWDNSGVQIAGGDGDIKRLAVTLDPTLCALEKCLDWGAQMVLTHHPLFMEPKSPASPGPYLEALRLLLPKGVWLYAAHTSLDCRPGGPAFWLGRELGLKNTSIIEPQAGLTPIEISFYSEISISRSIAEKWAERECVYNISQSSSGEIRLICDDEGWPELALEIRPVVGTNTEFYVRRLEAPGRKVGFGQIGDLAQAVKREDFLARLGQVVGRKVMALCGPQPETVSRVAYCPGSGSSMLERAFDLGADVFITGDMKYHPALEARGLVVDVGHFSLEEEMIKLFSKELAGVLPEVEVKFFRGEDPFGFYVRD